MRPIERLETRRLLHRHFVSPSGKPAPPRTGAAPGRPLQHAADTVAPGDVVTVGAGNYTGFHLETDGTAAAPITFRAEARATLHPRNAVPPGGINLEGANYVVIEGFSVVGLPRAGIRSVINTGAVIRNNNCDD